MVNTWFQEPTLAADLIDRFDEENRKALQEYSVASRLSTRWELEFGGLARDDEIDGEEVQVQCEGDLRLKKILWMLDAILVHLNWERTEAQVALHKAYVQAALPKIYSTAWERESARVMLQFGIREIKQLVLGITPRRFGKTTAVSTFCAVVLLCVPGITISTFSTGKRASSLLMGQMMRMMAGVPGAVERIVRSNAESLSVAATGRSEGVGEHSETAKRMAADSTTSQFFSYPSSVDGQFNTHTHTYRRRRRRRRRRKRSVYSHTQSHTVTCDHVHGRLLGPLVLGGAGSRTGDTIQRGLAHALRRSSILRVYDLRCVLHPTGSSGTG